MKNTKRIIAKYEYRKAISTYNFLDCILLHCIMIHFCILFSLNTMLTVDNFNNDNFILFDCA